MRWGTESKRKHWSGFSFLMLTAERRATEVQLQCPTTNPGSVDLFWTWWTGEAPCGKPVDIRPAPGVDPASKETSDREMFCATQTFKMFHKISFDLMIEKIAEKGVSLLPLMNHPGTDWGSAPRTNWTSRVNQRATQRVKCCLCFPLTPGDLLLSVFCLLSRHTDIFGDGKFVDKVNISCGLYVLWVNITWSLALLSLSICRSVILKCLSVGAVSNHPWCFYLSGCNGRKSS